ncbi:sigma 54-interacting transcriptional regulator [Nitrospinota bacterium]
MSGKSAVLCGYSGDAAVSLGESLQSRGFKVEVADRLDWLSAKDAHVIFCSLSADLPEEKYSALLEEIKVARIARDNLPILCTSEGNNLSRIVEAIKAGAHDYEKWPGGDGSVPERLLALAGSSPGGAPQVPASGEDGNFFGILGQSIEIKRVFDMIMKVSATSSTILLTGESGTGKELVCRAIHKLSGRSKGPLIPVNCGAIPEELLESELFGHEKGAFTGATTAREGRFQMADGGTILLDEVSEMSPKLQVKFLRVLQESEFERVGGGKTIRVDVRIIAATNKDLEKSVACREFREDLYYRLNVIPLPLPPLRERQGDISLLVQSFIDMFQEKNLSSLKSVAPDAMAALQAYSWPGNVRELENLIERMAILAEGSILKLSDLPERFKSSQAADSGQGGTPEIDIPEEGIDLRAVMEDMENRLIEKALEKSGGVKNRAAQLLGLNRTTLVEKLKKKGFEGYKAG